MHSYTWVFYIPLIVLLVSPLVYGVFFSMKSRKEDTCKHGVVYPQKLKNGKWRCPECYKEYTRIQNAQAQSYTVDVLTPQERASFFGEYRRAAQTVRARLCRSVLSTQEGMRKLDPFEFEDFCANIYRNHGFTVQQTSKVNDGGKDAIAFRNGRKILIECKHYASDAVIGRPLLQKFFAAMVEEQANEGHFIATCGFSKDAQEYAKRFGIRLIDLEGLCKLAGVTAPNSSFVFTVPCPQCGTKVTFSSVGGALKGTCINGHIVNNPAIDPMEPRCPVCDSKLEYITPKAFYRCCNYPSCHYKMSVEQYRKERASQWNQKM